MRGVTGEKARGYIQLVNVDVDVWWRIGNGEKKNIYVF